MKYSYFSAGKAGKLLVRNNFWYNNKSHVFFTTGEPPYYAAITRRSGVCEWYWEQAGELQSYYHVESNEMMNDIYYWGATELLTYAMTKTYLEDINFLLTTEKQIRFNKRMDRLYLDIDWGSVSKDDYLVIDCFRQLDPNDYGRVWNDSFLKKYATALMKRQWGQNLLKFQGVKLPGGVELNGRQIYDDAEKDLEIIREQMSNTYELPPLDMIG